MVCASRSHSERLLIASNACLCSLLAITLRFASNRSVVALPSTIAQSIEQTFVVDR